tara:strand:+ start:633 stop:827 length:195 start_codon:yes stop_codon:yes gene_type:complete
VNEGKNPPKDIVSLSEREWDGYFLSPCMLVAVVVFCFQVPAPSLKEKRIITFALSELVKEQNEK